MRSVLSLLVLGACANAALERVYVRRGDSFFEPGVLSLEPPVPTPAPESASSSSSSAAVVDASTSTSAAVDTSTSTSAAAASSTSAAKSDAAVTSPKMVFAHHMVGNTYNYNSNTWANGNNFLPPSFLLPFVERFCLIKISGWQRPRASTRSRSTSVWMRGRKARSRMHMRRRRARCPRSSCSSHST